MALDTSALAALAAFAVVLAVLGAVFYGIVQSGKAAAHVEEEAKQRAAPRQEEEVRDSTQGSDLSPGLDYVPCPMQAVPVVAAGRRNAASRMQATLRRRQEAAAAGSSTDQQPAQNDLDSGSGSEEEEVLECHPVLTLLCDVVA